MAELGRAHASLPDDLLNFQYDPVACAVAVGWPGAVVKEQRLQPVEDGELLRFQPDQGGRLTRVVVDLDGPSFTETWPSRASLTWNATAGGPSRASPYGCCSGCWR
jgi:purine nucleosidase